MRVVLPRWLLLPVALLLVLAVRPDTAAAPAAKPAEALSLVQKTAEEMLRVLRDQRDTLKQHPERIYPLVEKIVVPHFDFERMSRLVLGRHWREASPAQRQRFMEEFRNLLVRTYASALLEYSEQTITYAPLRAAAGATDITIHTEIQQPGGLPIPLDYRMHYVAGAWKVYDVIAEGVSLVTNYRSSFANEIRQASLDTLIERLAARNRRGT
jgi:phospholipid transport system substrate-binding protein